MTDTNLSTLDEEISFHHHLKCMTVS